MGYATRAEVARMMNAALPIAVSYEDPMRPGTTITCTKEDVLSLLSLGDDFAGDSQWVAPLYAEMARFERAALFAADVADMRYRSWKAAAASAFRESRQGAKAPTVAEVEDHYRTLPEYETRSLEAERLRAQAGIFAGVKDALSIKSKMIDAALRNVRGYEGAARVEARGEAPRGLTEMQQSARDAARESMEAAERAALAAPPPPPPPVPAPRSFVLDEEA